MSSSRLKPVALEDREATTPVLINGERFFCDWEGCLYWPDQEMLIVSDLHLEKGSSFACKGQLIPPYDTGVTLERLAARIEYWKPKSLISLGDSFHDMFAHERVPAQYMQMLKSIMQDTHWIWISGNHDPVPPEELGGTCAHEISIGPIIFRHEPSRGLQEGEIAGHLHPKGRIIRRSKRVTRPCFVTDGKRMIMPSFGAFTGGLIIRHDAFAGMFNQEKLSAVLLGKQRVFHISGRNLVK